MNPQSPDPIPCPTRESQPVLRLGIFRYSAVELLVTLMVFFIVIPFVEDLPDGDIVEAVLLTVVMVSSLLAVGGRRRALIISLALVVPALAAKWLSHFVPSTGLALVYLPAAILFFVFIVAQLLRFVLLSPRVDANVLCASLCGYLILGLLFAAVYTAVARLSPAAFTLPSVAGAPETMKGSTAFYFSFITLSTVGYGDILPVSKAARMLSVMEAITGLFYVSVLISRMVSLYSSNPPSSGNGPGEPAAGPN
jgi:voltage-gated potassium channel